MKSFFALSRVHKDLWHRKKVINIDIATMDPNSTIAVLGCGNIGLSIAKGIVYAKIAPASKVIVTRRNER